MEQSVDDRLRRASLFFRGRGEIYRTLKRIERRLRQERIDYVIIGAMALNIHGYRRFTPNVDIVITAAGLDAVQRLVGNGYVPAQEGARRKLRDIETDVVVTFLTSDRYPGDGQPKPVRFPDPADARIIRKGHYVVRLAKLLELKLAAGIGCLYRLKDLGDVQEVIKVLKLPRDLAEQLDPSVRDEYYRLWDGAQNAYDPSAV